jgi:hypothetical protein
MRSLDGLSGPWRGLSTQDGRRIPEAIRLTIGNGSITGAGDDADGHFVLDGTYDAEGAVQLTRRYTSTTEPSGLGVGIPYQYVGTWDGAFVSGRWYPKASPWYGGPFEMWPEREEDLKELRIELESDERIRELVEIS